MKYYIIAGEVSGDLHGSFLVQSILERDLKAEIRFWGGDKMSSVIGEEPVKHIKDLAFMGFVAVVKNLRTILKNIKHCKADILDFKPDVLVLIDYPGFNLRMAEFAKQHDIKVAYYIAPQAWAWKEGRVKKMRQCIDELMVILPFEKQFFEDRGMKATYVGHPLMDVKNTYDYNVRFRQDHKLAEDKPILALLPGSRKQELEKVLPVMSEAVKSFDQDYHIIVAGVSPNTLEDYQATEHRIVFDQTYDLLNVADLAVVTSGTATLETALHRVPEVVVYKGTKILYAIGKRLIKVPFISLVNLIAGKELVKELIQDDCNPESIEEAVSHLIESSSKDMYDELMEKIEGENAPDKTASIIFALANQ